VFTYFPIQEKSRHFRYADPAIGGGKTHSLTNHVAHPFTGKSIIGIQSIKLAKEIEADLRSMNIAVLRIDTEAFPYDPETPTVTCTSIFNEALKSGQYQVLIANHEVVLRAQEPYSREYELFMDEVPPIHERHWIDGVVLSHHTISSYITSQKTKVDGWRQIVIADAGEKFLAANHLEKQMPGDKVLYEAVKKVQDVEHYDVYAEESPYGKFRDGLEQSIVLHAIMKPAVFDKFARVTVLGANFRWSLMNLIWTKFYSVDFSLHSQIMTIGPDGIRYQDLKHKAATTTVYYHSEKDCSKTTYKQVEYQPTFDASHDAFKALLRQIGMPEDTRHLVFLNNRPKGVKKFYWKDEANAELLSPAARGWDAYKDIDFAIFLAACNEHPDTYRFLLAFYGLTKKDVDRATCLERAYQAVGRCSLRDMDSPNPAHLIFFEYRAAKHVADLIGCGEPVFLDTGIAALAKKVAKTDTERSKKAYHNKNRKAVSELSNYDGFKRRKWKDLWSPERWDDVHASWAEWVADTLDFAKTNEPPSKGNSVMYREGVFKPDSDHKVRGNIECAKVITLDFDEVSGDVHAFSDWLKSSSISHVIANSYSSTNEEPRFRLDIALDRPVNAYGYNHIVAHLIKEIEGEFRDAFIVDSSKKTITARFHMPSVSIYGADLFIDGTVMNGDEPAFLDVMAYMDRDPVEDDKLVIKTEEKPVVARIGTMSVEEVLEKYAVASGLGKGSANFHQAAIDLLFKVKLSREETIETLHVNRYRFGNGDDRDAEYTVDYILSNRRDHAA
jgi:hypothetical protein